jgi:hypothetical protein
MTRSSRGLGRTSVLKSGESLEQPHRPRSSGGPSVVRNAAKVYNMLVTEMPSSEVRVPAPTVGTALKVTRYGVVQAVVLNPEDYKMVEALLDAYRNHPPVELELSDVELAAHAATDQPENADEYDYDGLSAALARSE